MSLKTKSFASLLFLFGLILAGFVSIDSVEFGDENSGNVLSSTREEARVVHVVDGDTVKVKIADREETVRLIGIDSPESVHPQKPVECFAKEASAHLEETIKDKDVFIETDPSQGDTDKYGRLLRYIYLGDENINEMMVADGYAFEYTYADPYKFQDDFIEAEEEAREEEVGLWSPDICDYSELL